MHPRARVKGQPRIVISNLSRARKPASIARSGLLRRSQPRHIAQIGGDRSGHFRWHGLPRDLFRLVSLAHDRKAKSAGSPSRLVLLLQQRVEGLVHPLAVARDRLAQREPAQRFVAGGTGQGLAVIELRSLEISDQIERKAAVGKLLWRNRPRLLRLVEQFDRGERILGHDMGPGQGRLGHGIPRLELQRALVKPDRGLRIAQFKRGLARFDQRGHILRVSGEFTERIVQPHPRRFLRDWLNNRAADRLHRCRLCLLRPGPAGQCQPRQKQRGAGQSADRLGPKSRLEHRQAGYPFRPTTQAGIAPWPDAIPNLNGRRTCGAGLLVVLTPKEARDRNRWSIIVIVIVVRRRLATPA